MLRLIRRHTFTVEVDSTKPGGRGFQPGIACEKVLRPSAYLRTVEGARTLSPHSNRLVVRLTISEINNSFALQPCPTTPNCMRNRLCLAPGSEQEQSTR